MKKTGWAILLFIVLLWIVLPDPIPIIDDLILAFTAVPLIWRKMKYG